MEPDCIRLLENTLQSWNGIYQFDNNEDSINIFFNPDLVEHNNIIDIVIEIGCKVNMFYIREF